MKSKESPTVRDIIKKVPVNETNFKYIANTGNINGSLLIDLEIAMDTYAKQQAEAVVNEIENEWNGYESLPAEYVINLIKKHFNIV